MKILQLNASVNTGSTGKIAEELGKLLISEGHKSYIGYGRLANNSASNLLRIGSETEILLHVFKSRLFDLHGFGSGISTKRFIREVLKIGPDIIHLHNVHGYFLHIGEFFKFLKESSIPVIWTFHDCWPFTGHCSYFDAVDCYKWQNICNKCPNINGYPKSWFWDNSKNNFYRKRFLFGNLDNLTIVTPSQWLAGHVRNSFLKEFPVKVIYNGIDLDVFKADINNKVYEKYKIADGKYILGVANIWDKRKGLNDFIGLRDLISADIEILLVGLKSDQVKRLPRGIKGITRTDDRSELASLYSGALVYVNPTYVDNFPTTNIEALACGTPVVTYNTGGSPEAINEKTGFVVDKGDLHAMAQTIETILLRGKENFSLECRQRAETLFNCKDRFGDYIAIYNDISGKN